MADWAYTRAVEWLDAVPWAGAPERHRASLAALLREVAGPCKSCEADRREAKEGLLAEVRRVVEQAASDVRLACISTTESDAVGALRGALLSRLDKL